MGLGGQRHTPDALSSGKRSGTHFKGGWVADPRPILTGAGNLAPPAFDHQTVVTHYADYDIPAPCEQGNEHPGSQKRQLLGMVRHQRPRTKEGALGRQFIDPSSSESV